jgi:hypothetical protein
MSYIELRGIRPARPVISLGNDEVMSFHGGGEDEPGYLYRCTDHSNWRGGVTILIERYPIVRRTPQGAWIEHNGKRKFILLSARKKFAHPLVADAFVSYRIRKEHQIEHLHRHLRHAERALAAGRNEINRRKDASKESKIKRYQTVRKAL